MQLTEKLNRGYTESHPDIKQLKAQIAAEEAKEPKVAAVQVADAKPQSEPEQELMATPLAQLAPVRQRAVSAAAFGNPVLVTQMKAVEEDIAKQRQGSSGCNSRSPCTRPNWRRFPSGNRK